MRPTREAVILFCAGAPLSLVLVLIDGALWPLGFGYLGLAVFLTGLDGLRALPPRALGIEVTPPPVLHIGDSGVLALALTAQGGRPRTEIEVACDVEESLVVPPLQTAALDPDGTVLLDIPLTPKRRGTARVERLWLRWRGPLGLMQRERIEAVGADIPVIPDINAVRQSAIRFTSRDALFGFKPQSQQGEGSEFEALRDYVPGLDHRSIDWKHSARHRALVCKEFRAERNHQIVLAFDTGQLMIEPLGGIPRLDHAINAGLRLGHLSLRGGDRVGVFGFDSQVRMTIEPMAGMHNFGRLQLACAGLDYHHEETNFTLGLAALLSRLNRRSLVILQTEFVDTVTAELMVENLERMAARHLIVFVTLTDPSIGATIDAAPNTVTAMTRAVMADDIMRERLIVLERLRRLGIQCLDAPAETIGSDLINRYLTIKRKELI